MRDDTIWGFIAKRLADGEGVCLVTMVDAVGHGPNRPGSHIVVSADGRHVGTVGGGRSEYTLVERAKTLLAAGERPSPELVTMRHVDDESKDASGMICAGTQKFILLCLTGSDEETASRIANAVKGGEPGTVAISPDGLMFANGSPREMVTVFDPEVWRYTEPVGEVDTVTIIGGGHVSLALSPLLASIGMRVVVLDNRSELMTMAENRFADELRVIDYANVAEAVPAGERSYVCIMTFGHRDDESVLRQLVDLPLRYLGMMGSEAKVAEIRKRLMAAGVSKTALDVVHAPIGISIASNTPEEIAISIVAEIVSIRNRAISSS